MTDRHGGRPAVGLSVALVTGAIGVVTGNAAIFLASTVGLVYAAYEAATSDPVPELTVERSIDTANPRPGETVSVTVTVRNDGRRYLPDVRLVDGVPERLSVVDGTPSMGTTLESGASDSVTYAVEARRGDHVFGETTVVCRDLSGTTERRETALVETAIESSADVGTPPLPAQTLPRAGQVETESGGDGVAFYGVREYHTADPMRRIDWKRFARTTELATVEYRERSAATVVLLVDARYHRSARPESPTAAQFCAYAAERLAATFLAENDRVGAARFGGDAYLTPGAGRTQQRRLTEFVRESVDGSMADGSATTVLTEPRGGDTSPASVKERERVERLSRRVPGEAQVVFCTPLLDEEAADAAKRLAARGHAVTVISPDLTDTGTPGGTLAEFDRDERLDDLRRTVRVVDWTPTDPLAAALARASAGWSQ
ncbi:DUF58 domain-containing protein [Haloarcula marina]|uniref:DUF58 domain-containing protein n=1 Tax=Haloarcula marina TaxID=2961574 RepID=UPI0020B6FB61|nr:DUF58 domain-containing protein [Halomicroarcula marina]